MSFIDNTAGFFALRKGYCRDPAICNVLALVWRIIALDGWHLHLEWVQSNLNISDSVSRFQYDEMQKINANWTEIPVEGIYDILARVAVDSDYAHGKALNDMIAIQPAPLTMTHTGGMGNWRQCGRDWLQQQLQLSSRQDQLSQSTPGQKNQCEQLSSEQFGNARHMFESTHVHRNMGR